MYQDTFPPATKLQHVRLDWRGLAVVEVGCNIGMLGDYALERGAASYVGYDAKPAYITEGLRRRPHLALHVGRAEQADVACDLLVALGVFHHMPDADVQALLARTTAQAVLFEVPLSDKPFKTYRMRPRQWYDRAARAAGFTTCERFKYGFWYPVDREIFLWRR
jgi:trans-aconitate methyltransferase